MVGAKRVGARAMALAGLGLSAGYLTWRVSRSLVGAPIWLSVPALIVELVGAVAALLLVWALWPAVSARQTDGGRAPASDAPIDIVVRADGQPLYEVRATVLAAGSVRGSAGCTIVDLGRSNAVAALAAELSVGYAAVHRPDRNGLTAAVECSDAAAFLLLDAGDIPAEDAVERHRSLLADSTVAVVQGVIVRREAMSDADADDVEPLDTFQLRLNQALGVRGAAHLHGSGALVRRAALREVAPNDQPSIAACAAVTLELMERRWRLLAPTGGPLVVRGGDVPTLAAHADRIERSRAAKLSVIGPRGVFRNPLLTLRQRLSLLATAVGPLSGLRRFVFIGVVLAALLDGSAPFVPSAPVLAALWLPSMVLTVTALWLLSDGVLRPGDRARASVRWIAASFAGLQGAYRPHPSINRPAPQPVHPNSMTSAVVLAIAVVLALRGISDRFTHTIGVLPEEQRLGLLAVALWLLALALDAMRLLTRRSQLRRATRMGSSLPAFAGGRPVFVVDLTPIGAGIVTDVHMATGRVLEFESVIPTSAGCTTVSLQAVVRNSRPELGGGWRVGVEFQEPSGAAATALVEYCMIEPARSLGVERPPIDPAMPTFVEVPLVAAGVSAGRVGLRLVALAAFAGAIASAMPERAGAADVGVRLVTGQVVATDETIDLGGTQVVGVCSLDVGDDGVVGTADDTYSDPVSTTTDELGTYSIEVPGAACWLSINPPSGVATGAAAEVFTDIDTPPFPAMLVPNDAPVDEGVATVADVVFADTDADGVHDADEPGLADVTVALHDQSGSVAAVTYTDESGSFQFHELGDGEYGLVLSDIPDGYTTQPASPLPARIAVEVREGALATAPTLRVIAAPKSTDHGGLGLNAGVVLFATALAVSVAAGSVVPLFGRRRRTPSGDQSTSSLSPDLAMR